MRYKWIIGYFGRLKDKILKCLDKKRHTLKFVTNAKLLFL